MPMRLIVFRTADELTNMVNSMVRITGAAIVAGGTGYTVGDVLYVKGGAGALGCTLEVATAALGVITGITVLHEGAYTTAPTNPVSVSGGTGNDDATFNLTATPSPVAHAEITQINFKDGSWYLQYWV